MNSNFEDFDLSRKINTQEILSSKHMALAEINLDEIYELSSPKSSDPIYIDHYYEKYNSNVYLVSCIDSEQSIFCSETDVDLFSKI